jgi:hypothetical protein
MKQLKHDSTIFNIKTPEFFINLKKSDIPPENSIHREAFVLNEFKKCDEGLNVNGVFIPPTLYYDLNFHKIELDTPKGRTVANPYLRDNGWIIHNDFYRAQKEKKHYCISGSRQISKDLLNSSLLYKEDSTTTIGEIKIGEKIFDDSGNLTEVIGVYPQGIKPVYKITMLDGRELFCGLDHNWYVFDHYKNKYSVKTTRELLVDFKCYRKSWEKRKNSFAWRYSIDLCKSINYIEKELPIDPYLFGIWTGDGDARRFAITTMDSEIVDYIYQQAELLDMNISKYDYKLRNNKASHYNIVSKDGNNIFNKHLKRLNLIKNKHVPDIYKYGSFEQRLEFLKGCMDSDGTCTKGSSSFTNSNYTLIKDLEFIVRSLGMGCKISKKQSCYTYKGEKKQGKLSYGLQIYTDIPIFKLKRKYERQSISRFNNRISIENIEYVYDDYTTCIEVNNESHLFLTDGFTITHNTDTLVSLTMREINLYKNTEALLLFGSSNDKSTFSKKSKIATDNGEKFLIVPPLDNDWRKDEIRYGYKEMDNTDNIHARLYLYITAGGNNAQVGSGKSLSFFAYDEIAKFPFKQSWNAIKPAFKGKYGYRNAGFFSFTGGEAELSKDAESFFLNPEANELLEFDYEGKKVGRFMGGWYRADFKKEIPFVDYLERTGIKIERGSCLDKLTIEATDFEYANIVLDKEEKLLLDTGKLSDYNDQRIFFPRDINSMFLKTADNPFSTFRVEFEKLLKYLESIEIKKIDFDEQNKSYNSSKLPLFDYPYQKNNSALFDSPLCVVDEPRLLRGTKLYCAGSDPFNTVKTAESASLGSFYIMRRETSDYSDSYNNRIVAWYNGRKDISHFRKILTNSLEFYGAESGCITLLHEASDDNLTQHFSEKNKSHYLEDTYTLSREINPNANSYNSKGLRPTPRTQNYGLQLIIDYCEEELPDGKLGLWRIPDPYLVKQLMNFDGDYSDKDAIIAFLHALIHLKKESKYRPNVSEKVEVKEKPKVTNNAFGMGFSNYKKSAI